MEDAAQRWMDEGVLIKTPFVGKLAPRFLEKARNNLITMSILFDLHSNKEARKLLQVPEEYDPSEWIVVSGYYSMYMAASAALAKVGYRSKNHTATIAGLDSFFVRKKLLEPEYAKMIENAQLEQEVVDQLRLARERREIAQYSVTKETTGTLAKQIKEDAYKFVERIEKLVQSLSEQAEIE